MKREDVIKMISEEIIKRSCLETKRIRYLRRVERHKCYEGHNPLFCNTCKINEAKLANTKRKIALVKKSVAYTYNKIKCEKL